MPPENAQNLSIPIAIVAAGALIAGAVYLTSGGAAVGTNPTTKTTDIPAVTAEDHILGNPDAEIVIVEYTDLECPFCKQFHATMETIMDEYGQDGQVAWVMRNFPLVQLHPNAPKIAEAAECVAELGGNAAYWKFIDSIFTQAPINTFFDVNKLTPTAQGVGVNASAFEACLTSEKYKEKIQKEFNDVVAAGGKGTPHSIVITKDGEQIALPGSQPIANVRSVIDAALK